MLATGSKDLDKLLEENTQVVRATVEALQCKGRRDTEVILVTKKVPKEKKNEK